MSMEAKADEWVVPPVKKRKDCEDGAVRLIAIQQRKEMLKERKDKLRVLYGLRRKLLVSLGEISGKIRDIRAEMLVIATAKEG